MRVLSHTDVIILDRTTLDATDYKSPLGRSIILIEMIATIVPLKTTRKQMRDKPYSYHLFFLFTLATQLQAHFMAVLCNIINYYFHLKLALS